MRDVRVQAASANWGPRLIANGVDYDDFVRTTADLERNRVTTERAVRALYDAHALLDPAAERVEAPVNGGRVVANLRRPGGPGALVGDWIRDHLR